MSKTPNKAMIGLFTIAGIALFIGFMMLFLWDKLFIKKSDLLVMYFEESIQGLNVGSPVVLKGVEIGRVINIEFIADDETLTFKIPVYITINKDRIITIHEGRFRESDEEYFAKQLVAKGLRARLSMKNFLTGQLMVELDMQPGAPLVYRGNGKVREIPTILSPLGELSKSLQTLPLRSTLDNFNNLIIETSSVVNNIGKIVNASKGEAAGTAENVNRALKSFSEAAQSIRNLTDYLERYPESLLVGKKGGY